MSKIFNEDSNFIKEEIDKIKDSLLVAKPKELGGNFDMLEFLLSVYAEVFNEADLDSVKLFKVRLDRLFKYPSINVGPVKHASPIWPYGNSSPLESIILSSEFSGNSTFIKFELL